MLYYDKIDVYEVVDTSKTNGTLVYVTVGTFQIKGLNLTWMSAMGVTRY